jgi:hypothetical protein
MADANEMITSGSFESKYQNIKSTKGKAEIRLSVNQVNRMVLPNTACCKLSQVHMHVNSLVSGGLRISVLQCIFVNK